jgi:hypothetical protein
MTPPSTARTPERKVVWDEHIGDDRPIIAIAREVHVAGSGPWRSLGQWVFEADRGWM